MMLEGSSVLIVDDSVETLELLSDCLSLNDCKVMKAETGGAALDIMNHHPVDIAIVDINLPDMNGISVLDVIKTQDPTIAVVMITGFPEPNFVVNAMKKGASDFLIKPFELDKLMMVMMRVSRERQLLVEKKSILDRLEDKKKIEVLNRRLQKKIEELTIMFHISNKLNALSIMDDVYEKMVQIVREILDVPSCGYYLADREKKHLVLLVENRDEGSPANNRKIALSKDFFARSTLSKGYVHKDTKLFLPLIIKEECIGFMSVGGRRGNGNKFSEDEIFLLKLITEKVSTKIENRMLYESLFNSILHTLESLIIAINRRDSYTEGHCGRVTSMTQALACAMGMSDYEKHVLRIVGPVHDLGKIGIPDAILLKPDRLTSEEYEVMKGHSIYGEEIMKGFEILAEEARIIRHHHERFDGKGYPDALAATDIPSCCRVIAVCDAWDAMTTDRPYKKALTRKDALLEIKRCGGSQFHPDVASSFLSMQEVQS
jgi:response regulator RpfG family c-di-GMP phosphodiesterase